MRLGSTFKILELPVSEPTARGRLNFKNSRSWSNYVTEWYTI